VPPEVSVTVAVQLMALLLETDPAVQAMLVMVARLSIVTEVLALVLVL
jgi:hypothetical protein